MSPFCHVNVTLMIVIAEYMKPNMTKSGIIREIVDMPKSVV